MLEPSMTCDKPKHKGIQVLRGLAAGMVVIHHIGQQGAQFVGSGYPAPWTNGSAGVDIFFVISGFVMFTSYNVKLQSPLPAFTFFTKRILRVVPLYWLVTALYSINLLRAEHQSPSLAKLPLFLNLNWQHFTSSLFFIPFRNAFGVVQPILPIGWTLCFEMFFYLMLTLVIALRLKTLTFLTSCISVLAIVGCFHQDSWPAITSLASPLLLEFLAGLYLARVCATGYRAAPRMIGFVGFLALACIFFLPISLSSAWRVPVFGICAALVVLAAVTLEPVLDQWWPRWALLAGDISYSLYLVHLPIVLAVMKHCDKLQMNPLLSGAIAFSLSIFVALAVNRYLEKPMTKFLSDRLIKRRSVVLSSFGSVDSIGANEFSY